YDITKGIYENLEPITAAHAKGAELVLEKATDGISTPMHPGAVKYFTEKGVIAG
ncbi:MAG: C4-dicarboxylate ABC transporter substrate-binding protein, partial [Clostridia bacterium]|nr:C4-dicarboxylate ABC transporter substrate-binding protein [Clostridia bacterium]